MITITIQTRSEDEDEREGSWGGRLLWTARSKLNHIIVFSINKHCYCDFLAVDFIRRSISYVWCACAFLESSSGRLRSDEMRRHVLVTSRGSAVIPDLVPLPRTLALYSNTAVTIYRAIRFVRHTTMKHCTLSFPASRSTTSSLLHL